MAQGLKPSTAPNRIVKAGSDSDRVSISPMPGSRIVAGIAGRLTRGCSDPAPTAARPEPTASATT